MTKGFSGKSASAGQKQSKPAKTSNPLALGLADVKPSGGFFDPEPGTYILRFTEPPKYVESDEETGLSSRMVFRFEIESSHAQDDQDYTGMFWTHTYFIPEMPSEEMDEADAERQYNWRMQVLGRIKSIFAAAGVEIEKNDEGLDIYDEEAFVDKKVRMTCRYLIDRETGEPRLNSKGYPIKNFFFSKM